MPEGGCKKAMLVHRRVLQAAAALVTQNSLEQVFLL
jgi:hypothetical protein